jgi:hypothetical protein
MNKQCPVCGFQFGFDDATETYESYRERWVLEGCNRWSTSQKPPSAWNPQEQLGSLGDR